MGDGHKECEKKWNGQSQYEILKQKEKQKRVEEHKKRTLDMETDHADDISSADRTPSTGISTLKDQTEVGEQNSSPSEGLT